MVVMPGEALCTVIYALLTGYGLVQGPGPGARPQGQGGRGQQRRQQGAQDQSQSQGPAAGRLPLGSLRMRGPPPHASAGACAWPLPLLTPGSW